MKNKLKDIESILDEIPSLTSNLLTFAEKAASYYQYPIGEVINHFLTNDLKKARSYSFEMTEQRWLLNPESDLQLAGNATKQKKIMAWMQNSAQNSWGRDDIPSNFTKKDLSNLIEKKLLLECYVEKMPANFCAIEPSLPLNEQQQQVLDSIQQHLNTFHAHLLHGVTGSGKTELYLQIIESVQSQRGQVLVLVPEIGLTPQTTERFKRRFGPAIRTYHSNLNDTERRETWEHARRGLAHIVIGTRSALFANFKKLSLIIVDEEHDISFKQQDTFRYSARDMAILRAQLEDIPVVLGSATPSLESLHNCEKPIFSYHALTQRATKQPLPELVLTDIREQPLHEGLAPDTIARIEHHLSQQQQVLIFINRRGYAPVLMCHSCGWVAQCQRCDANYTIHMDPPHLHCHHCDHQRKIPTHCPDCKSHSLIHLGSGTERLLSATSQLFPEYKSIRIDRDSMKRKHQLQAELSAITDKEYDIVIGTQMLAKGHHFPHLTLVVILDIDQALFSYDFRGTERAFQLVSQVSGRAGREQQGGEVVIQTHQPDHFMLTALKKYQISQIYSQLLEERERLSYPPFGYLAVIRAESKYPQQALNFLNDIFASLEQIPQAQQTMHLMPPTPAPMEKRAGRYRANLLLQSRTRTHLHSVIKQLIPTIESKRAYNSVRWSIDIDPQDLL
ncbi:MAG: primosomal protein N' [Pseudomonadota bacterium]